MLASLSTPPLSSLHRRLISSALLLCRHSRGHSHMDSCQAPGLDGPETQDFSPVSPHLCTQLFLGVLMQPSISVMLSSYHPPTVFCNKSASIYPIVSKSQHLNSSCAQNRSCSRPFQVFTGRANIAPPPQELMLRPP